MCIKSTRLPKSVQFEYHYNHPTEGYGDVYTYQDKRAAGLGGARRRGLLLNQAETHSVRDAGRLRRTHTDLVTSCMLFSRDLEEESHNYTATFLSTTLPLHH